VSLEGPLISWVGWDVRGGKAAESDAAESFTRSAPDGSGPDTHYELMAVAGRGFRPPRYLSTALLAEEDQTDPHDETGSGHESLRRTWSLVYRRIVETTPAQTTPFGIYLLGVNPPAGATDEELGIFNDFYTDVHLPEVAERRHALRAVRYELVREVQPPYQGAPRYLAVYEMDEAAASNRRHVGPKYSSGPDVWQRHTTPWRLWFRQLVPGAG